MTAHKNYLSGKPVDKEEKSKVGKGAKGRLVKQQSLPHDASAGYNLQIYLHCPSDQGWIHKAIYALRLKFALCAHLFSPI